MFEVTHVDPSGARIGQLHTASGVVETPAFMPVATNGSVKTLSFDTVAGLGFEALISNAFVLYLRPGLEVIEAAGGLHKFMGWDKTVFTDSGGFQMLSPEFLGKTSEKGVLFRSPIDRSRHMLTPEACIDIQNRLGSDVAMVLDDLVPFGSDRDALSAAASRTTRWAGRCKEANRSDGQLLFAITQGGTDLALRRRSAEALVDIGFDGYAIGGLSIGEPKDVMSQILREQARVLPEDRPRYLMGLGSPTEIIDAITSGMDIFDSTFPTRNARHNGAYTFKGYLNISRGGFKNDTAPIEDSCKCYACKNHSRAYIHHLLRSREQTGKSLMTIHNLYFMQRLMALTKEAIREERLLEFKEEVSGQISSKYQVKV
ncbi:queuine tRNA-ribosyltransferase [archaeon BMS3Abin16]|nr:queuine tRNA-ribosyltransferase [archaeon BMS3Abin16]